MMGATAIQPKRWSDFYSDALRESGNKIVRQHKVNLGISVCLRRLKEIPQDGCSEREAISTALDDLKILRGLYSKEND